MKPVKYNRLQQLFNLTKIIKKGKNHFETVFVKSVSFLFVVSFSVLASGWRQNDIGLAGSAIPNQPLVKQVSEDSSGSIHIINASSLKRLPAVLRDLFVALKDPIFQEGFFPGKSAFSVYLYDVTCDSFENSAALLYHNNDTVYQMKLNRFNRKATDKALAATLIHEFMHCILLEIYKTAIKGEEKTFTDMIGPGLSRNDFFFLMNSGEDGQHELMYRLFYTRMVLLLEHFARIHKEAFSDHRNAEFLMWSGLQKTNAFKKLSDDEKIDIGLTILKAKGFSVEQE